MPPVEYKVLNFPLKYGEVFDSLKDECGDTWYFISCPDSDMDRGDLYNVDQTTGFAQLKI